jgi:hypothetical protein
VLFRAFPPVGLESTFGHEKSLLLIESMALRQTVSINDAGRRRQTGSIDCHIDPSEISNRDGKPTRFSVLSLRAFLLHGKQLSHDEAQCKKIRLVRGDLGHTKLTRFE